MLVSKQKMVHLLDRGPIGVAVAVGRRARDAHARLHERAVKGLPVENILRHEDVGRDRDHKGDVIRRLEHAGDHEALCQERVGVRNGLAVQTDLLPEREGAAIHQLLLHGALRLRLGEPALQQLRPGDLPGLREHRDAEVAALRVQLGVDLPDALRLRHSGQSADRLQILFFHQQGRADLEIPQTVGIEITQRVFFQRGRRIGDAEIGQRREQSDDDDREIGDDLLADIAACIQ